MKKTNLFNYSFISSTLLNLRFKARPLLATVFLILIILATTFVNFQNSKQLVLNLAYSGKESDLNKNNLGYIDEDYQLFSQMRQITFEGPKSGEGYFNHDGTKMIFQSERVKDNPFYQMFILDLKTQTTQIISTGVGKTTCGWIHPSDKKTMWSSTHLDQKIKEKVKQEYEERAKPVKGRYSWSFDDQYDIFESDLNGKNIKQLTKSLGYDAEGAYSPDGKYIVFASNRSAYDHELSETEKKKLQQDASYFMEIYIMKADGSDVKRLTQTAGYDGGPFFSADGRKITWRRFSESGASAEIMTMNVDGSDQKQITRLNSMSWAPFFHPSGDYIVFASTVGGYSNFELFIVDSEGKNKPVRVTHLDGFDGLASFSPDGQTLTWSHRNEKGESQIYLAQWNHEKALKVLGLNSTAQLDLFGKTLSPEIKEDDTKKIVTYLTQPGFNGRYTGSSTEIIYSQKIADLFKSWGLKPYPGHKSYLQEFEFISDIEAGEKNKAEFQGRYTSILSRGEDYQIVSYSQSGAFQAAPVVFAGYGIKAPASSDVAAFDAYKNLDVKGKWVVILDESPKPAARDMNKHTYLLSFARLQHKITVAKQLGAYGILVVSEGSLKELKFSGSLSDSQLPILKISSSVFWNLVKSVDFNTIYNKKISSVQDLVSFFDSYEAPQGFVIPSTYFSSTIELKHKKSKGFNVVAVLPAQKNQTKIKSALMIGAHGDHLGMGLSGSSLAKGDDKNKIHSGADDNASGVSGVLELAHYFSQQNQLSHSMVFAVWSGEEIGLLGSSAFAKNKNLTQDIKAYFNMDMIGQLRQHLYIQGVGSGQGFKELAERVSLDFPKVNFSLSQDPYLPTDSMAFYLAGVPAISFFTGSHGLYHTPQDKADTLNYEGLVQVINILKGFIEPLVGMKLSKNYQQNLFSLKYEKVEGEKDKKLEGRGFRIYLGTIPDYTQEGVTGVRLTGTSKNSPAEKAGLQSGDIIVEFDKTKIENIYDYVYLLQSLKPNIEVMIKVLRNGKSVELKITPLTKE